MSVSATPLNISILEVLTPQPIPVGRTLSSLGSILSTPIFFEVNYQGGQIKRSKIGCVLED